jgi:hypothetical protein
VPPAPDPMSVLDRVWHEVERSNVRARNGITEAPRAGRRKVVCRTCRRSGQRLAIVGALGCTGAAVLHDYIHDRNGAFRELVLLAYCVDAAWESAETTSVADELGSAKESGKGAPA